LSGFSTRLYRRPGEAARFPASFLDALAERLRATRPKGKASLIAIDGWGCGGKTALAEGLLDRLEPVVQYFGMDDFFVGFGHEDAASPVPHLRWGEVREALACLGATGRAAVRTYDWEGARVLPPRDIEGGAWLVEGFTA